MPVRSGGPLSLLAFLGTCAAAPDAHAQAIDAFNPQPQAPPTTLAIQADGKILLGGYFLTATSSLVGVQRLNLDGSVDASFSQIDVSAEVKAIAVQTDGKIVIGGHFDMVDGQSHHYLARLNANGSLDGSFVDPHLDADVWAVAVQADGNVLAAGDFQNAGATARAYAARFTPTGGLDGNFADPQLNYVARALALQANGSVLVGGFFLGTVGHPNIGALVRFNTNGALDTAFPTDPPATNVDAIAVAPDGSIYVGSSYNTSFDVSQRPVAKLSATGTLDTAYADMHSDGGTNTIALQPNGKVLFGGNFQVIDDIYSRHALARLNGDGTLDTGFADLNFNFNAGDPNGSIFGLAAQADGKLICVGNFTLANGGQSRQYAARVVTTDAVVSKLAGQASGTSVIATWTRTGEGPELAQTPLLMHSSDGVNYTAVGAMTRIVNGWQTTANYNVAGTPFYLQAVATTSNGAGNGSSGRVASPVYVSDRVFADGFQ